jgi:LmbE family N-acetylglucosaminyl deacetylase
VTAGRRPTPGITARLAAAALLWPALAGGAARTASTPAPLSVGRSVRALVISPHPDDGALAAGGLMRRIIQLGGSVQVVQMTGGDAFPKGMVTLNPRRGPSPASYRWYGSLREREAIRALHRLGVGRSHIRLLGYPDEGLCLLAGAPVDRLFVSPYTARESPPLSQQLIPGAMYRQQDLVHELSELIVALRPTLVVLPHCGDQHPDHCATHLLVHQALSAAIVSGVRTPRLLHYVLHYPGWPALDATAAPLTPPAAGRANDWEWRQLTLTTAEQRSKAHALDAYQSQMMVMADFLKAFERPNELFVEGDPDAPLACWCNGENIAAQVGGGRDG